MANYRRVKPVRVKINPRLVEEFKREQKEGYKGTIEEYYNEFYGPIHPYNFEKGGAVNMTKDKNYYKGIL